MYFIGRKKRSPQTAPAAPPPVGAPPPGAPPLRQCTATNKSGIRRDCIFPFRYESRTYYECTEVDSSTGAWCATQVSTGDGITAVSTSYTDCDPGCPGYRSRPTSRPTQPPPGTYRSRTLKSHSVLGAAPSFLRLLYYIKN